MQLPVVCAAHASAKVSYFHISPFGGHLRGMRTLLKILEVAWWPTVHKYLRSRVRACLTCQQYKGSNVKPAGHLQTMDVKSPDDRSGLHEALPAQQGLEFSSDCGGRLLH